MKLRYKVCILIVNQRFDDITAMWNVSIFQSVGEVCDLVLDKVEDFIEKTFLLTCQKKGILVDLHILYLELILFDLHLYRKISFRFFLYFLSYIFPQIRTVETEFFFPKKYFPFNKVLQFIENAFSLIFLQTGNIRKIDSRQ